MNRNPMVVLFSTVEGALVDRGTDFARATCEAVDRLAHEGIPLILCSSNTRAEIQAVQRAVSTRAHPFIVENGAALYVPAGYFAELPERARPVRGHEVVEFSRPYPHVALTLHLIADQLGIEVVGYSDLSPEQIAADCDLTLDRARLAKLREYDEPFRIVDSESVARRRLVRALHAAHLFCISGNDYYYASGVVDAGAGIEELRRLYEKAHDCPVLAIGIGNGLSDAAMLREVDLPVILRAEPPSVVASLLKRIPTARVTGGSGPAAWCQAVVEMTQTIQHMRGGLTVSE